MSTSSRFCLALWIAACLVVAGCRDEPPLASQVHVSVRPSLLWTNTAVLQIQSEKLGQLRFRTFRTSEGKIGIRPTY